MKTPYRSLSSRIRAELQWFGVVSTLYDVAFRAVNKLTYFRVLKTFKLETIEPESPVDDGFQYAFLGRSELLDLARDPRHELSAEFVKVALAKGDECFAVLDGERLVAYGWWSHSGTPIKDDVVLRFDERYVYRYKSYTAEEYRGRHVHGRAIQRALRQARAQGYQGLICYVESHNLSSLRSCRRAGYREFGRVFVLRLLGRYLVYCSPGCRRHGLWVESRRGFQAASAPPAEPAIKRSVR
jgi:ribosomal protein S18 acetylase RimI-like enzyme